jgi:hypothetical protein
MKVSLCLSLLSFVPLGQVATSYKIESKVAKPTFVKDALDVRGGAKQISVPKNAKTQVAKAKIPDFKPSTTGASIPNEVFNLVKAIVGVGVLSLPAGAYCCNFES